MFRSSNGKPHQYGTDTGSVTMRRCRLAIPLLGYRKTSFIHAHRPLRTLEANLEDLEALRQLQKLLLREVMHAEEKIRQLKSELRKTVAAETAQSAKRLGYVNNRIEGFRRCAFVWRCFVDVIAFLYLDGFSLKQCFYSTETTNPKQDAGFILGKEGLADELAILDSALEHGVPALLVDLTNTIRHGDVCLLGGPDPYLIEAKLGKKVNSRGRRQKRSLEKLHTFYEADEATSLRGFTALRRRSNTTPVKSYLDVINECIRDSVNGGHAVRKPEHGLYYLVVSAEGSKLEKVLDALGVRNAVWPFFLNQHKADRTWAPYSPFVLSIRDCDHLWDFIHGKLVIVVFIELDALCKIADDGGYKATFDSDDGEYPLRIEAPDGSSIGVSSHMLMRIGMEFLSPRWIVRTSLERVDTLSIERT